MSDEITQHICARCRKPIEGDPFEYIIDGKPVDRPCFDAFSAEANAGPAGSIVPQPPMKAP